MPTEWDHISEADFQTTVIEMAGYCGWKLIYHTRDSRGSAAGFPDLVMIRGDSMIVAELKSQQGRVSPAQLQWYGACLKVEDRSNGAVQAYLWRPSDLDDIERVLQRVSHPTVRAS